MRWSGQRIVSFCGSFWDTDGSIWPFNSIAAKSWFARWSTDDHPSEAVKGFQAHALTHVSMQLPGSWQLCQAKQHFGSVGLLFGGKEDDGATALKPSGADRQQHSLLHCLVLVLHQVELSEPLSESTCFSKLPLISFILTDLDKEVFPFKFLSHERRQGSDMALSLGHLHLSTCTVYKSNPSSHQR